MSYISFKEQLLGMPTANRPVTATLYVSQNGNDTDGTSWEQAYNTLNQALDAASTDAQDHTLILLAPGAYDINVTGDPTWSANVEIHGGHRRWATITNSHASATSILKLTGQASLQDLAFPQTAACGGVILTQSAFRVRRCGFNSAACTGAVKAIHIDGSGGLIIGGLIEDVRIIGNVSYTTGIYLNQVAYSDFKVIDSHFCLAGVQIINANSDNNFFNGVDFGGCALGLDIDAGNSQHFTNVYFHENTLNIDDEVGDHHWQNIQGEFTIMTYPEDLTGTEVACGDDDWGADVELRAAATATKPFKVVAYTLQPSNAENTLVRFSADSGSTFFAESIGATAKNKASGAGDATDFIFNVGTRISASAWSPAAGRTVDVWLDIQEI